MHIEQSCMVVAKPFQSKFFIITNNNSPFDLNLQSLPPYLQNIKQNSGGENQHCPLNLTPQDFRCLETKCNNTRKQFKLFLARRSLSIPHNINSLYWNLNKYRTVGPWALTRLWNIHKSIQTLSLGSRRIFWTTCKRNQSAVYSHSLFAFATSFSVALNPS